jgi:hypothetical protein
VDVVVPPDLDATGDDRDGVAQRLGEALTTVDERALTVCHCRQGNTSS